MRMYSIISVFNSFLEAKLGAYCVISCPTLIDFLERIIIVLDERYYWMGESLRDSIFFVGAEDYRPREWNQIILHYTPLAGPIRSMMHLLSAGQDAFPQPWLLYPPFQQGLLHLIYHLRQARRWFSPYFLSNDILNGVDGNASEYAIRCEETRFINVQT